MGHRKVITQMALLFLGSAEAEGLAGTEDLLLIPLVWGNSRWKTPFSCYKKSHSQILNLSTVHGKRPLKAEKTGMKVRTAFKFCICHPVAP